MLLIVHHNTIASLVNHDCLQRTSEHVNILLLSREQNAALRRTELKLVGIELNYYCVID